jgi:hypothetical protein
LTAQTKTRSARYWRSSAPMKMRTGGFSLGVSPGATSKQISSEFARKPSGRSRSLRNQ